MISSTTVLDSHDKHQSIAVDISFIETPLPVQFGLDLVVSLSNRSGVIRVHLNPIKLIDGTERKFINDYDTVIMKGFCHNSNVRIGFGEVSSQLLPPFVRK